MSLLEYERWHASHLKKKDDTHSLHWPARVYFTAAIVALVIPLFPLGLEMAPKPAWGLSGWLWVRPWTMPEIVQAMLGLTNRAQKNFDLGTQVDARSHDQAWSPGLKPSPKLAWEKPLPLFGCFQFIPQVLSPPRSLSSIFALPTLPAWTLTSPLSPYLISLPPLSSPTRSLSPLCFISFLPLNLSPLSALSPLQADLGCLET